MITIYKGAVDNSTFLEWAAKNLIGKTIIYIERLTDKVNLHFSDLTYLSLLVSEGRIRFHIHRVVTKVEFDEEVHEAIVNSYEIILDK